MKNSTLELLCCPLCKAELQVQLKTRNDSNVDEGSLVCCNCRNEYSIRGGIPMMYIPDDEIAALADTAKFSKFIITPDTLNERIKSCSTKISSRFFTGKALTVSLVALGWVLLLAGIPLLIMAYLDHLTMMTDRAPFFIFWIPIATSAIIFTADYLRYRIGANAEYLTSLKILKGLSDDQNLSEFDIRQVVEDGEEKFAGEFEKQKEFVAYKGNKIASALNIYGFQVANALNIGCGGALHKAVSEPYYEKQYNVIGVDVSRQYLKEYNQVFNSDVIQANAMALPIKSNNFDLVNFTDIVEHLHNPLLGLSEAQRVLKDGGVIILSTNNATFSCRLVNPLVFIERLVSLYYDKVLPPRKILGRWMDINFYHTEFSKNEITDLIETAGFEILSLETHFSVAQYDRFGRVFQRLPALRFMFSEFMIVARKDKDGRGERSGQ